MYLIWKISLCHNYCLGHGSVCTILEDHPVCFCADNHHGDRYVSTLKQLECQLSDKIIGERQ